MDYVDISEADELACAIDFITAINEANIDLEYALTFLNANDQLRAVAFKALNIIESERQSS